MLHGEPYIQEYRQNIEKDLSEAETYLIVKGQVKLWQIDLEKESNQKKEEEYVITHFE